MVKCADRGGQDVQGLALQTFVQSLDGFVGEGGDIRRLLVEKGLPAPGGGREQLPRGAHGVTHHGRQQLKGWWAVLHLVQRLAEVPFGTGENARKPALPFRCLALQQDHAQARTGAVVTRSQRVPGTALEQPFEVVHFSRRVVNHDQCVKGRRPAGERVLVYEKVEIPGIHESRRPAPVRRSLGELQGQAALAHPACAGEDDPAKGIVSLQELLQPREFLIATDQGHKFVVCGQQCGGTFALD